ncbi:MAG TPA: PqqD family protein [Acidimicrobiia bacterium]|nr:PqqD family protein [Acidimicrobiia bacterium]
MTHDDSPRWIHSEDVLTRSGPFGVVLLGRQSSEPVTLTRTGPAVWDLLAHPRSLDDLTEALAERHEGSRSDVRRDVASFLDELARTGLIRRADRVAT